MNGGDGDWLDLENGGDVFTKVVEAPLCWFTRKLLKIQPFFSLPLVGVPCERKFCPFFCASLCKRLR